MVLTVMSYFYKNKFDVIKIIINDCLLLNFFINKKGK
jgi:hypothetical protein